MKLFLLLTVILTLIVERQCGLTDGFFDRVKNTTHHIRENIGGAFRYGKDFVFGEHRHHNTSTDRTHDEGMLSKISHRIHDASLNVKNVVFSMFSVNGTDDKFIIGRLADRIKNHVVNGKKFLFGDKPQPIEFHKDTSFLHNKTTAFSEAVKKYLNSNKSGPDFGMRKTLASIIEGINTLHRNITKKAKEGGHNTDGAGLIDVRAYVNSKQNDIEDEGAKVKNFFVNAEDNIKNTVDDMKQNTQDFIEKQKHT